MSIPIKVTNNNTPGSPEIVLDAANNPTFTYYHGAPPKPNNEVGGIRNTTITGPVDFASAFVGKDKVYETNEVLCEISEKDRSIKLKAKFSKETSFEVNGKLTEYHKVQELQINSGKGWTVKNLEKYLRLNTILFENREDALDLIIKLRNPKLNYTGDSASKDDLRGNKSHEMQEVLITEMPKTLTLNMPIFEGERKEVFEVALFISRVNNEMVIHFESEDLAFKQQERASELLGQNATHLSLIHDICVLYSSGS